MKIPSHLTQYAINIIEDEFDGVTSFLSNHPIKKNGLKFTIMVN